MRFRANNATHPPFYSCLCILSWKEVTVCSYLAGCQWLVIGVHPVYWRLHPGSTLSIDRQFPRFVFPSLVQQSGFFQLDLELAQSGGFLSRSMWIGGGFCAAAASSGIVNIRYHLEWAAGHRQGTPGGKNRRI